MPASIAIDNYLRLYSEAETAIVTPAPRHLTYRYCVVIPTYNEPIDFFRRLQDSQLMECGILLIVVVNQPECDTDTRINRVLWDAINRCGPLLWRQSQLYPQLCWRQIANTCSGVILVDRFTAGRRIPDKQGVGLARKVGVDIAVMLLSRGQLQAPWVHSTDADTQLPADYFSAVRPRLLAERYSALVYPFYHRPLTPVANTLITATRIYEQAINYYVQGLAWAGSPYAYHSLGSAIAINAYCYCQARGFPKRSGAEDFYLLNKLNKIRPVYSLSSPQLIIAVRESTRAPFGTGPAVAKIQALTHPETDYYYYNPKSFKALKELLRQLPTLDRQRDQLDRWLTGLEEPLAAALTSLGIHALFNHLQRQGRSRAHCSNHFHQWFDAFKTLKLIRQLRYYYPDIPLHTALSYSTDVDTNRRLLCI